MIKKIAASMLLLPALLGGSALLSMNQPAHAESGVFSYRFVPSSTGGTYYYNYR